MEPYNDFFISGSALPGPPYTDYWHAHGSIDYHRANGSVVEIVRFTLNSMTFPDQDVARWFGFEIAKLAVDACYKELLSARDRSQNRQPLPRRR